MPADAVIQNLAREVIAAPIVMSAASIESEPQQTESLVKNEVYDQRRQMEIEQRQISEAELFTSVLANETEQIMPHLGRPAMEDTLAEIPAVESTREPTLSPDEIENLLAWNAVEAEDAGPTYRETVAAEETAETSLEEIVEIWGNELEKEPAEILDDFTDALFLLIESDEAVNPLPVMPAEKAEDSPSVVLELPEQTGQTAEAATPPTEQAPVPVIVRSLAEGLSRLEPAKKVEAAVLVQNIVGAVHGIHILEERQALETAVETVREQLTELCIQLFESVGIEYTPADVEQFVRMLLAPEFRPIPHEVADQEKLDLTKVGTREAKHFSSLSFVRPDGGAMMPKTLGTLAVLYVRTLRASRRMVNLAVDN